VQPDPENPQVINGDFELPLDENGFLQGWYYQRLLTLESDPERRRAGSTSRCATSDAGRMAHVMQGFPIDGRKIQRLDFSASVKYNNTHASDRTTPSPLAGITFYDERREELGPLSWARLWAIRLARSLAIGPSPCAGTRSHPATGIVRRHGEISFDNVRMSTVKY
jgi:protein-L-isoaspartate(D-aspartate) O-methyltransferase